jgi:hypothetical protein
MSTPQLPSDVVNTIINEYALPPGMENSEVFKKRLLAAPHISHEVEINGEALILNLYNDWTEEVCDEFIILTRAHMSMVARIDFKIRRCLESDMVRSKATLWSHTITEYKRENEAESKYQVLIELVREWRAMRECTACQKFRRPLPGQTHCMQCVLHP